MDRETQAIVSEQKKLADLLGNEGWVIARNKFAEKVLDLQNAFNIEDKTPEEMVIDLRARKMATILLWDFLKQIEGAAEMPEAPTPTTKDYIVQLP